MLFTLSGGNDGRNFSPFAFAKDLVPLTTSSLMHRNVFVVARCSLYLNILTLWSMIGHWLDRNLFACNSRVLVVTELVVSGTQCSDYLCLEICLWHMAVALNFSRTQLKETSLFWG